MDYVKVQLFGKVRLVDKELASEDFWGACRKIINAGNGDVIDWTPQESAAYSKAMLDWQTWSIN